MNEFYVGYIFDEMYPPEAAAWCNENRAYIAEIEPQDGVRRFQIVAVPEPSRADIISARLSELQAYLDSTDWYCARYVDTGVEIPADVKSQRQAAREEISSLRDELAGLTPAED